MINIVEDQINEKVMPFVRRPGRYIGGEVNQIKKDLSKCALKVAICFPDVYEVAMSNTGIAIIYDILNSFDDIAAERVFSPWTDAEELLRKEKIPLFTLESKADLKSFDVIGFSLTNELCYTNVLNIIDLAGIEVRSDKRGENDPIIIAGGGMSNCCEPIADFIDLFVIGEGEDSVVALANHIKNEKAKGSSKQDILFEAAKKFKWAYVPCFYEFEYENDKVKSFTAKKDGLSNRFENAVVEDFENAPVPRKPIVPFIQAVQERVSVEVMRGCPGRCRFCQASFCRRPIRFRSKDKIVEIAKAAYAATGFDTVSLLSLSTADYPQLEELATELHGYFEEKRVGLSLPSLRVDQQLKLLPDLVTGVRKSGLTIAIEAASERVRKIVNKFIKDEDLFAAVEAAYQAGWQQIKLYFMAGLPGETQEDLKQIVHLSYKLAKLRKKIDNKTANINVAVSWLVPKPHTPLGWLGQRPEEYFKTAKQVILDEKFKLRAGFLQFKFHNIQCSILESAIGRGDRRLGKVIEEAWRNGARFDLWSEMFNYQIWEEAFAKYEMNINKQAEKSFAEDEILPWEHLGGPEKSYVLDHYRQAMQLCECDLDVK
ncbi:MAG TPA: TIGR03960 family B12-binding radical SAM protein [Sedimentisphaerales bacterium]|nr:TIGR03960 family B12-binding radical SAM protein [Sedimentisphaerales bacterium]